MSGDSGLVRIGQAQTQCIFDCPISINTGMTISGVSVFPVAVPNGGTGILEYGGSGVSGNAVFVYGSTDISPSTNEIDCTVAKEGSGDGSTITLQGSDFATMKYTRSGNVVTVNLAFQLSGDYSGYGTTENIRFYNANNYLPKNRDAVNPQYQSFGSYVVGPSAPTHTNQLGFAFAEDRTYTLASGGRKQGIQVSFDFLSGTTTITTAPLSLAMLQNALDFVYGTATITYNCI